MVLVSTLGRRARESHTLAQRQCPVPPDSLIEPVLNSLMRHLVEDVENAKFFREPVDAIKWKIPDYFEIVKDPMDFGTIRTKLDVGVEYRCVSVRSTVRFS